MQELVWQVVNDCNEEAAKLPLVTLMFSYLDFSSFT